MNKKSLSKKEQKEIIQKLRSEYINYSKEYNNKVFDLNKFESRFQFALKNRFDLDNFLFAEITTFEQLKNKIEQKKENKKNRFIDKVDQMIEVNLKKIDPYPEYNFHPDASYELKKLLGALDQLVKNEYYLAESIIKREKNSALSNQLRIFNQKIDFLITEYGSKYAPRITDHILIIDRQKSPHSKIETDEKHFIKDIALFLNELKDFIVNILYNKQITGLQTIIKTLDFYIEIPKAFSNITINQFLQKLVLEVKQILSDFRIQEFKARK